MYGAVELFKIFTRPLIKDPRRKQRGIQRNTYHTFYNETHAAELQVITRFNLLNDDSIARGLFQKALCLTRPTQARQDAPFHRQGRRRFSARSVLMVREYDKAPRTPLADPSARLRECFFNSPLYKKPDGPFCHLDTKRSIHVPKHHHPRCQCVSR